MKWIVLLAIVMIMVVGCNAPAANDAVDQEMPQEAQPSEDMQAQEDVQADVSAEVEAQVDVDAMADADVDAQEIAEEAIEVSNANDLLKGYFGEKIEYQAVYDMNAMGQSGETTHYFKGDRVRIDLTMMGIEARTFVLDDIYACNSAMGSWMCFKTDSEVDMGVNQEVQENVDEYEVKSLPGRTIAGAATDCFEITVEDGVVEYCYSKDSVPLYVKTTSEAGVTVLSATSYSKTVADSAFTLPAEATAIPSY